MDDDHVLPRLVVIDRAQFARHIKGEHHGVGSEVMNGAHS
jgi:hypothetical protein